MDNITAVSKNKQGLENAAFEMEEIAPSKPTDDPEPQSPARKRNSKILSQVSQSASRVKSVCEAHYTLIKRVVLGIVLAGFLGFLIAACILNLQRALALLVMTCVAAFFIIYDLLKRFVGKQVIDCVTPVRSNLQEHSRWIKWIFSFLALVGLVAWLAIDTAKRPEQLISFGGLCLLVLVLFIFSKSPRAVSGRSLFIGLGMQFVLGIFIIRTEPGFQAFEWLGTQVQIFLNYTTAGSSFLFGNELINGLFAFQALPIVVFFSCVMSILYYVGVMQWVIIKIAWLMQVTMGTSATESLSVAGNIFVGQTEAPLLIRPYLNDLTKSEIHAVMTGGFATIAGSVLGAYISFGISASSLIAASVMAAPCALALSKLSYPELEESKFMSEEGVKLDSGGEQNILEAASNGASASIGLVANIAVNLLAFLAILEFLNAALSWFGGMVDYPELTFQLICSYVFMPIAFMMGVDWNDSFLVAELIGIKLFLNEFVAYQQLSAYQQNRLSGVEEYINGKKQWISVRAETLSTYSLCGFANLSSLGIMLGGLSSIAPMRKSDMAEVVIHALFTGFFTSLVNACVAGILFVPREFVDCVSFLNGSSFNGTSGDLLTCCNTLYGSVVTIGNGTVSFTGEWSSVNQSVTFLYDCCGLYNSSVCTV
ncbi:sodium/nucleoside cotransporter 1 [Scyliorhinus canicula]|uniref:sodium/nucleoside cotransporter 1 n=1 Tax=Scyliorhinus canicula TaxID=7830 RepID=UPI0018F27E26|nr:sodium/nucleoside cotransporter 1 [Scyliorhinus canicula]XP_038640424.1 sodium/nucleoside cotransporter 1 [Scyliorhinus canicula]XP_038640427.1 sodium/nucleoside cotransporter 1 [Scyliorhinus canicula]XP_038640428.1 sodium/nucleoside cotransporter 1 [Scyliorhinus canicula]XP_038640429.1 sodium/nucleoside cotransporter 1 [Scyliorhinus canicula]XP_038640430.1 sodium/nucleoside cotransporter 1 [Scyliorhinus canicula]XP_038640431.1 sodium/nucleoside cotransporter 1 [Scyliorhinus canicula]